MCCLVKYLDFLLSSPVSLIAFWSVHGESRLNHTLDIFLGTRFIVPVYRGPVAIIYTTACNKSCACANNESPRLESTVKLSVRLL